MSSPSAGPARPLVYVCDPSAEATRLESALAQAGYDVVDVPRHRLVERVRLERPAAIVLDVVDESGLGVVPSIRSTNGGEGVHVLFVAARGGPLRDAEDALMRDGSGLFLRPVDPSSLVRKIEALVGPGDLSRDRGVRARPNVANAPDDLPSGRSLEGAPASTFAREQALPELADDIRALLSAADARAAALDLSGAAPPIDGDAEIELILGPEDLAGIAPPDEGLPSERDVDDGRVTTANRGRSRSSSQPAPQEDERSITQTPLQVARQRRTTTSTGGRASTAPEYRTPPNVPAPPATLPLDAPARSLRDAALAIPRTPAASAAPREGFDAPPTPSLVPAFTGFAGPPSFGAPPSFAAAPPSFDPRSRAALPADATIPPQAPEPAEGLPAALAPGVAPELIGALVRERASGVLTFADGTASRAITLREGDVSVVQSTHPEDNLVVLLERRGLLARDALGALNLSPIPRLACAALVARGFLAQDDLWPALRLHGEQVLSAMLASIRGSVAFVAGRVAEDGPSPFGALSGAAVFVRAFLLAHDVGTLAARAQRRPFKVVPGPHFEGREDSLGGTEAARDLEPILDRTIDARSLPALGPALATLEALALLGVVAIVDALPAESERAPATPLASPLASASLDADALRLRIGARRKLVDEGDYFALLGVSPRANAFEIRQAYLELRRTFEPARVLQHPELRAFEEDLRVILEVVEEAYVVLRDDARRERYRRAIGLAS
jgi:hypothetical protein